VGGEVVRSWEAVEAGYFAVGRQPRRSNHRHVELVRDAVERPGETVMGVQDGPSAREFVEWGLL
jgi:hypothetical protein